MNYDTRSAKEISLFGKENDYKLLAVSKGGVRVCCRFWQMGRIEIQEKAQKYINRAEETSTGMYKPIR